MSTPKDIAPAFKKTWWPVAQSFELVRADPSEVAGYVQSEFERYTSRPINRRDQTFVTLDEVFASVGEYAGSPTILLVLPTHSAWTVIWSNSSHCNGYDSLSYNLTRLYHLETIHASANDASAIYLPGAFFCYRSFGETMTERAVHAIMEDGEKWTFFQKGPIQPCEIAANYKKRRIRDRLNEPALEETLANCGLHPWRPEFYDLSRPCTFLQDEGCPAGVSRTTLKEIRAQAQATSPN